MAKRFSLAQPRCDGDGKRLAGETCAVTGASLAETDFTWDPSNAFALLVGRYAQEREAPARGR